ncbi:hypothetical protein WMY93_015188 [Mugilogobius chulae]|uniref:Uncharacterized protein n=1 Tax=Mugilogobius chulae TaxID=88201 RepID=A0AAW0NYZ5_9GOBI
MHILCAQLEPTYYPCLVLPTDYPCGAHHQMPTLSPCPSKTQPAQCVLGYSIFVWAVCAFVPPRQQRKPKTTNCLRFFQAKCSDGSALAAIELKYSGGSAVAAIEAETRNNRQRKTCVFDLEKQLLSKGLSKVKSRAQAMKRLYLCHSFAISVNVEQILRCNPAGQNVVKEYEQTGMLKDSSRRIMVNVIVAAMCEKEGRAVCRHTKEFYALGIVEMFPSLKDPYSKKGYEHFYDIESNSGFLQCRLKTVQHQSRIRSTPRKKLQHKGGPTSSRLPASAAQHSGDECLEAMSLLNHTTDRQLVFSKMRQTFSYR